MSYSIVHRFFTRAYELPNKSAVHFKDSTFSYADLARLTGVFYSLIKSSGVTPGNCIILSASNTPQFIAAYFAIHLSGAICVPVDPDLSSSSLAHIHSSVEPKLIFTEKPNNTDSSITRTFDDFGSSQPVAINALLSLAEAIPRNQAADIIFTSGTTGKPKGVLLNHSGISAAIDHINTVIGLSRDDKEVVPLPLCHSFGLGRMRCLLSLGSTLILEQGFSNPKGIIDSLLTHRATGFSSVPAGLIILLRFFEESFSKASSHLKYIEIGSAPMPLDFKQKLIDIFPGTRILMHYGLTEASRSTFLNFRTDSNALESVGFPSPKVNIRIVDQNGGLCPTHEKGHIEIQGPHVFERYWRDPAKTNETISNGWIKTGDIGYFDEHGYLYLISRESELINIAGKKVAPQEIENVLERYPSISACGCVGIPDPDGITGAIIIAYLVHDQSYPNRPKISEIAKFARNNLESYKLPSKYFWTNSLPKTDSGKIKRYFLAEMYNSKSR